jgi:peptide/nickel transport system ATP-binding protein
MSHLDEPLLELSNLSVEYPAAGRRRPAFRALNGVSLIVEAGKTHGIVGESGSGKTTIGRAVLGLAPVSAGHVRFKGSDIGNARRSERRRLARDIQVVFQDPYSSLNPSMTVGDILSEPLVEQGVTGMAARTRVLSLLDQVALPSGAFTRRPHEFSGGQRQRIAIARSLALQPALIVCDEPVSALDLINQARILDLLLEIQRDTGTAYLFVSHDLDVIRHVSHAVSVVLGGEIVEQGLAGIVTQDPEHDYTRKLVLAAPVSDVDRQSERRAERLAFTKQALTNPDSRSSNAK